MKKRKINKSQKLSGDRRVFERISSISQWEFDMGWHGFEIHSLMHRWVIILKISKEKKQTAFKSEIIIWKNLWLVSEEKVWDWKRVPTV